MLAETNNTELKGLRMITCYTPQPTVTDSERAYLLLICINLRIFLLGFRFRPLYRFKLLFSLLSSSFQSNLLKRISELASLNLRLTKQTNVAHSGC